MSEQGNQYQHYNSMPYDSTGNGTYSGNTYGGAQDPQYAGGSAASGQEPGNDRKKKESGFGKKLAVSAACALVFGAVAGVTMTGVNRVMTKNGAETQAAIEQSAESAEALERAESAAASGETEAVSGGALDEVRSILGESGESSAAGSETRAGYSNLDVSAIVEKAMPSVVSIDVTGEARVRDIFGYTRSYETAGAGSGILIGEDEKEYLIVTNNHVVANTKTVTVQFIDGESVEAQVKGTDSGRDVAVIAVSKDKVQDKTKQAIKVAEMGDSDSLKVGQGVIAIGNALGYGQSVTVGYVSALNRTITAQDSTGAAAKVENLLQTDAAINPGNSGGALLDMQGRVIGINESKSVDTTVEGMGYAIPISTVKELIGTLSSQKTREEVAEENRGFIGFQGQNVDQDAADRFHMPVGIFVYKILEDSAAASSELREQDIITQLDGMTVSTMEELKDKLARYEKGEKVTLTIQRPENGEYVEKKVDITLGAQPQNLQQEASGETEGANAGESGQNGSQDGGADQEQSQGDDLGSLFGIDGLDEFFRNGGFQFRW